MSDAPRREPAAIPVGRTAIAIGISLAILVALVWATGLLHRAFGGSEPREAMKLPSAQRLEAEPGAQLRDLRAWEDARLASYAWADRGAGVVRIPIERAMDLVVEREKRR